MQMSVSFILPRWPAPPPVRTVSTTRAGGVSRPPFDTFNLAMHVGDVAEDVRQNRARLREEARLPAEPRWLRQVHGTTVVDVASATDAPEADGSVAERPGAVCAVLTADCLPVLLCDRRGTVVAALHAGWRGLAAGIIEAGMARMQRPPQEIIVWLGPAIGPDAFEVGEEVRDAFMTHDDGAQRCFRANGDGRWRADLYALAARRLSALGVEDVYGGGYCTLSERRNFFSYRRDDRCGRMASLIWLEQKR